MMASAIHFSVPFSWHQRTEKVRFALEHGYGVEIGVFASGDAVDDPFVRADFEQKLTTKLRRFPHAKSMHGAFMDLAVHSGDSLIAHHSRQRILDDLKLAERLGCQKIVFHTGFNQLIPSSKYRGRFIAAQATFWQHASASCPELTVCLENQWENDPSILLELMKQIDRPNIRLCLDVGHAHAYSTVPVDAWVQQLAPFLAHMHWSDNWGEHDSHLPLGAGSIDWASLLSRTEKLGSPMSIVLELNSIRCIEQSLIYLDEVSLTAALSDSAPSLPRSIVTAQG